MSHRIAWLTVLSLFFCLPVYADDNKQEDYEDKAAVEAFMRSTVVQNISKTAYGYAIFPNIGKAGVGIGGAFGTGRVFEQGKKTGVVSIAQVSFGFQLGAQAYRQIVFFQDKRAYDDFTSGEFKFSAQAEAIAVTASAGASAGTEGVSASANEKQNKSANYFNGMAVFTMGKGGLMYQATLGGQKYNFTSLEDLAKENAAEKEAAKEEAADE